MKLGLGIDQPVYYDPLYSYGWESFCDVYRSPTTGTPISQVNDISGNGNNYTFGAGSLTFTENGYNGRQSWRKTTAGSYWQYISSTAYTDGLLMFCAIRVNKDDLAAGNGVPIALGNSNAYLFFDGDSGDLGYRRQSSTVNFTFSNAISDFNNLIFIALYGDENGFKIYCNGQESASFIPDTAFDTNNVIRFGDLPGGVGIFDYYAFGDSRTVPTKTQLDQMYNWARARYSPLFNPFGIGVAGQSPAVGVAPDPDRYFTHNERMYMYNTDQVLRIADDPVDRNTGAYGGIVDDVQAAYGMHRAMLNTIAAGERISPVDICVAKGGTAISQWARNASNPEDTTTFYGILLTQLKAFKAAYGDDKLKALVWWQGESDAIAGTSRTTYEGALMAILTSLRTDLGQSDLYIVINTLHQWSSGTGALEADWNDIQLAQSNVASALSNCDVRDNSAIPGAAGDVLHVNAANNDVIGAAIGTLIVNNVSF